MSLSRSLSQYCWKEELSGPDAEKSGSPHQTCARPYTSPYVLGPTAYTAAHMHTCQVRPFSSPSPKIAQRRVRMSVRVFPSGVYLTSVHTAMVGCMVPLQQFSQFYHNYRVRFTSALKFSASLCLNVPLV